MYPRRYVLLGVLVLAAFLRLLHLGSESLWYDEAVTAAVVRLDWMAFWKVLSHFEANMGLYYFLLRLWTNAGDSEWILRSFSALTGVLAVALVYVLGKRLFDAKVGLVGAALLATNSFHIQYSQEARAYSLMVLLTALSSLFFLRAVEHPSRNQWAAYILTSTLAVYTHFFSVLVLGAQWACLVLVRRRVPWRQLALAILAICVLLIPLALFALRRGTGQIAWIPRASPQDAYYLFHSLFGGGTFLVLAYAVFCGVSFLLAWKAWTPGTGSPDGLSFALLWSWLLVPLVAGFVISVWQSVLVDRYFIICLPPLVLLAAAGISRVRFYWISVAGLAVLLSLSGRAALKYYSALHKEDWRGATAYVVSSALSKDAILFYLGPGRFGFDYYVRRLNPSSATWQIAFPEPNDWSDVTAEVKEQPSEFMLRTAPKSYGRVWLVLAHQGVNPMRQMVANFIQAVLQGNYPDVREREFRGVEVLLYQQK